MMTRIEAMFQGLLAAGFILSDAQGRLGVTGFYGEFKILIRKYQSRLLDPKIYLNLMVFKGFLSMTGCSVRNKKENRGEQSSDPLDRK
jgi:hypothetical protein